MGDTRCKRRWAQGAELAAFTRMTAPDNSRTLDRVRRNLGKALREDVTPRQRQVLELYYGRRLNMRQIGGELGVSVSTVSRTIKRGEARLRRCLRYGAAALLEED